MYQLDTESARKADQRGGQITETGKYLGVFTKAEDITTAAPKNTRGIDFAFKSNGGQSCRFAIYTEKGDGSRINIGHAFVMAMLTCLRLRAIQPTASKFKKWDNDAGAEVDVDGKLFHDLQGKPIGVLLEAEDYTKNNGDTGRRMVLAGVFQADTELTASEILDRKTVPAQLAKIVESLRDRKARPAYGAAPQRQPQQAASIAAPRTSFDDMDDDIPF
jgi:hypothetical protein